MPPVPGSPLQASGDARVLQAAPFLRAAVFGSPAAHGAGC